MPNTHPVLNIWIQKCIYLWLQRLFMFENIFSEQNLNLLLKQSFTLKENSFLCGYRSYISKQPFTVQSQFLTTYELR